MNETMKEISTMSFEEALSELESVVERLDTGNVSLEDSIKLYERGNELRKFCEKQLNDAELKIRALSQDESGNVTARDATSEFEGA